MPPCAGQTIADFRQRVIDRILPIHFTPKSRTCGHIAAGNLRHRRRQVRKGAMQPAASQFSKQLETLKVLIVDDEPTMRKVTRSLLHVIGVNTVYEAYDGRSGLDGICRWEPDVVILDWAMPSPNGPEFVRRVRTPGTFPFPDVPIIMLTAYGDRSRVVEAVNLGVNEFLLKPVSSTALYARLFSVFANPRPMVRKGDYYGPEPRQMSSYKPELDPALSDVVFI
jgi:CheY-like chemotaxis protein